MGLFKYVSKLNIGRFRLYMLQPHFWKSVKMTFTLPKWGLGSPSRLLKLQSEIAGVKTPRIGVFFISLKSYESVDVEKMSSHQPFGHMQHKLCVKEGSGVKLTV